ncbi:unnamed protein product [Rotaria sordida]|uniref:Uncharacterized protein n=1 Tax=Rotaria sordida TaxID=392033 RepID=A0A814G7N2_9BILA|nr:unnamed protein product [Rotaria sordida]CAF1405826.1 unnamed protein product [Rotaria sordida]
MMKAIDTGKVALPDHGVSRNMICLAIEVYNEWPINAVEHLSTLIDLSRIQEVWLLEKLNGKLEPNRIKRLLQEASNIRMLGLSFNDDFESKIANIGPIVSRRIDHLKLHVASVDCMRLTLKYVRDISTITFEQRNHETALLSDMIEWLVRKRWRFTVHNNHKCVQIRLDEDIRELSRMKRGHKRKRST